MTPNLDPDLDPVHSPSPASPFAFPLFVNSLYASVIRHAPTAEAGLGGRLLYVGKLDDDGRALMVAANIAGAASLAATADQVAGKQAIREGVADFLVMDLDEALRILKNEVRKREPVAVCVAAVPEFIEQEMLERGVLPDLIRQFSLSGAPDFPRTAITFGESPQHIAPVAPAEHESILAWSVAEAPAQWLPRLDGIAIECLSADESPSAKILRRWLRFAPRYLGRLAANTRVLRCPEPTANDIARRIRASTQSGEITVPVRIEFVLP
jgi:hypothetical protein